MSKPIPQIRVPKLDALVVGASHLDGVEVISRDDKLWSPARAVVVEGYREKNLGHDDSLKTDFCSIIRVKVDEGSEGWRIVMRGRHDGAELRYLICSAVSRSPQLVTRHYLM
jgi:hypothetical protein